MEDLEMQALKQMELAPWIQKATALIGNNRNVGGNQFRHCMAAMIILIDYHFIDSVLLKASITHDLLEDSDKVTPDELMHIDDDSPAERRAGLCRAGRYPAAHKRAVASSGCQHRSSRDRALRECSQAGFSARGQAPDPGANAQD